MCFGGQCRFKIQAFMLNTLIATVSGQLCCSKNNAHSQISWRTDTFLVLYVVILRDIFWSNINNVNVSRFNIPPHSLVTCSMRWRVMALLYMIPISIMFIMCLTKSQKTYPCGNIIVEHLNAMLCNTKNFLF